MISRGDDYPLHQTPRPVRDPGTDRNLYDRFFFNGYPVAGDDAGHVFFAVAFGQYLGRNVSDAAFSVVVDGVQRNVRGSRLLGDDRLDLTVGPVTVEIVEPLRRLRVVVDAPEAGIAAELLFTARGPVFEEPRYHYAPGHLVTFDITRMTQNGTWSGWIEAAGRRLVVDDNTWWGTRDRSWGSRPSGAREANAAPDTGGRPGNFYWLWAPLNFTDMCVLFDVNEYPDGTRWHENAMVSPAVAEAAAVDTIVGTHTYSLVWKPGTRHATAADLRLLLDNGQRRVDIHLDALLTFFMSGIGYTHPTWGHGMWVGPNERTNDEIALAAANEQDPLLQHVQILSRATRDDGVTGMGILEMLIAGPHAPSGFMSAMDFRP